MDTTPCFRFVIAASASPRGQLLLAFRVRLARGTGFPNRHRSRACRPPGTDSADTGQPRESTVQTLRSAVMRRVAAGGKLECVFPRQLAPSIAVRAALQKARASQAPDRRVPERWRSPCRAASRAHIASLNRSERRASQCMQENFRSKFTSKRQRSRSSAPLRGHRPMRVPAGWKPLFPKSTYRNIADIGPEKAPLRLRGVLFPAGCRLRTSSLIPPLSHRTKSQSIEL